jgi:hypothetical protein
MSNISQYVQALTATLVALYALATFIGGMSPNSKIGQLCRRFAADLAPVVPQKALQKAGEDDPSVVPQTSLKDGSPPNQGV